MIRPRKQKFTPIRCTPRASCDRCRYRAGSVRNPLCKHDGKAMRIQDPVFQCPIPGPSPRLIQQLLFDEPTAL